MKRDIRKEIVADQELERLKVKQRDLLRRLDDAKRKTADLVAAVYRAARDAADALDVPPVKAPRPDTRRKTAETAIAVLSDWQLAKITPSYSSRVCEERIERYAEKVRLLAEIQRADHPVRWLRVYLLGDIVEGELIFPGQSHLIDASLYRQVLVDGPRILGNFLRSMLTCFEGVHVVGVIGNHGALGGRSRREYHPESNADAMLYQVTRMVLENEPRLTWAPTMTAGERHWHATDTIGKKTFLLWHGDQVKGGFAGYSWYGVGKKLLGWRTNAVKVPFDYSLAGHFHTPVRMYLNGISHWGNGSTESDNTYAAEQLAACGEPCQWLLFCHPEHGVTAEYLVRL